MISKQGITRFSQVTTILHDINAIKATLYQYYMIPKLTQHYGLIGNKDASVASKVHLGTLTPHTISSVE